eukprot:TRINITY_DN67265_c0_g1_i1.p1 TRINITY_DN67265_c0_g1~~TRINITY_DN67265_c0_g1_i1.p1  ORF type:complete len:232 (+),score=66.64 TRINITY_DN67265_c0_g1_i1:183-878(+)
MSSRTKPRRYSDTVHDVKPADYLRMLDEVMLDRRSVDQLVMNYLEVAGHEEAAEEFRKESGVDRSVDGGSIQTRNEVRQNLLAGDVPSALATLQASFPQVLDDEAVQFCLRHQQLIELIKEGDVEQALDYARDHLASPDLPEDRLDLLEQGLALMAFESPEDCAYSHLLSSAHRRSAALSVDQAILESQNQSATPALLSILRLMKFIEEGVEDRVMFPRVSTLVPAPFGPI